LKTTMFSLWESLTPPVVDGSPRETSTKNPEADQLRCLAEA
jgi:hypothetical protein